MCFVAGLVYALFLVGPRLGTVASWVFLIAAGGLWIIVPPSPTLLRSYAKVSIAMVFFGVCYVSILHFPDSRRDGYDLAANRFIDGLPGDNRLPHDTQLSS